MAASFKVARHPEPDSSLPSLISLPLGNGEDSAPLVLKARDTWPRTAKVYCHRADGWPHDVEVVDEVAVRSCLRRGPAIDLVLARPRENRSQLVFTRLRNGREATFRQTARTNRQARPGLRVPSRRASGWPVRRGVVDTRERYANRFADQQVEVERRALPAGDDAVELDGAVLAALERKSLADLAHVLVDESITYLLSDLACLWRAAVGVEDRYPRHLRGPAGQGRVPARPSRPGAGALSHRPGCVLRQPPVGQAVGVPLPRRRAGRGGSSEGSPGHRRPRVGQWRLTVSRPGGRGRWSGSGPSAEEGRGSTGQGAG